MAVALACLAVGFLALMIGVIWFTVNAFREHVGWGFAVLCLPFANFVFIAKHWQRAKRSFLLQCAGLAIFLCGIFAIPKSLPEGPLPDGILAGIFSGALEAQLQAAMESASASADDAQAQEQNARRFEALRAAHRDLQEWRASLAVEDREEVLRFNEAVRQYQAELHAAQQEKASLPGPITDAIAAK